MSQIEGTFRVRQWEEAAYDAAAGLPKLVHARVTHELAGGIEGEASVSYLMGYRTQQSASFVGLVRVTGTVQGHAGSFVMQDIGTFENGVAKGRWTILPGLGTGGLREIRGGGHFAAGHTGATYLLDVEIGA